MNWNCFDALSHQFELCSIDAATKVILVSGSDQELGSLVRNTLARVGAETIEIRSGEARPETAMTVLSQTEMFRAALEVADLVVDACGVPSFSMDKSLLVRHGRPAIRWLGLTSHAKEANRFPPNIGLGQRVEGLRRRIESSKHLRISSSNGTDLMITTAGAALTWDWGTADMAGIPSYFPSGWVQLAPARHAVSGRLHLDTGDCCIEAGVHLRSGVRLRIRDDLVSTVDSDRGDELVSTLLGGGDSTLAPVGCASISIGLNPALGTFEFFDPGLPDPITARLRAGTVTVSFGENLLADRPSPIAASFVLARQSISIDDVPVIHDGRLVAEFAPDIYEFPDAGGF